MNAAREDQLKHQKEVHASRMQLELLARQRDEARDEAATLRTSMRKARKDDKKATEAALEPLHVEIKRLNEQLAQKNAALRKADSDASDMVRRRREAGPSPAFSRALSSCRWW